MGESTLLNRLAPVVCHLRLILADLVQVVSLIQKCSESNGESVQLGVVRALLTVTTAEHFVLHGDALISVSPSAIQSSSAVSLLCPSGIRLRTSWSLAPGLNAHVGDVST